jgi:hypothetical protein
LRGVRFGLGAAIGGSVEVQIELPADSLILIGYIGAKPLPPSPTGMAQKPNVEWLAPPELETNTHADERGGLNAVLTSALRFSGCPGANIHALGYEKGKHTLSLGTGGFIIAGVIPKQTLKVRDAGLEGEGLDTLDWLYE